LYLPEGLPRRKKYSDKQTGRRAVDLTLHAQREKEGTAVGNSSWRIYKEKSTTTRSRIKERGDEHDLFKKMTAKGL